MSRRFLTFLKYTYGFPVRRMYNLSTRGQDPVFALKPPYILLSNHLNTFDPILISLMHNRLIHWVAADTLFRNPYLRYLFRRVVGLISKSKSRSDYYTIKQITKVVRRKGVVGLFPEGQRSWDGRTLPLFYSTAKLVRMLGVPIVVCTLEGGYHTLPRWSDTRRRGELRIVYQKPIMPEQLKGKRVDEIYQMLTDALSYDAYEFQKRERIIFKSERRAEYVEHVLYLCPHCGSLDTLRSKGNDLKCTNCSYEVSMDSYGFFTIPEGQEGYRSVAEWNSYQRSELSRRFSTHEFDDKPLFGGDTVKLFTGYRDSAMTSHGEVLVNMTSRGITARTESGKEYDFSFDSIDSLTVAMQRNLEFYKDSVMYRLQFPAPRGSAYKYLSAYEVLMEVSTLTQTAPAAL